jgi:hypothetical protein
MKTPGDLRRYGPILALLPIILICGCPAASQKAGRPESGAPGAKPGEPAAERASASAPADAAKEQEQEKAAGEAGTGVAPTSVPEYEREIPASLGEPLVDDAGNLKRLELTSPVWIDPKDKQVVLIGSVCKAGYPLEFFATYPDRGYESVVVVYTKPSVVHAALLALGAKPGRPVQYEPAFAPPSGTEVEIDVAWKDKQGTVQKSKAQEWIRDIKTRKPLDVNWVFAGSVFWDDKTTGEKSYLADRGDFITVLNLPTALLDVPIQSASALESRLFESFAEHMPPAGTPVTIILKPKLGDAR